ncbi:MAG: hypothetical protein AAB250_08575, partial [Bdellovibrionota bacterium]
MLDLPATRRPDPNELCEYAACLIKVGAYAEALRLLQTVSLEKAPEAAKFMGFASIHQWDYTAAIPFLKRYIDGLDPKSYEHLIGSMNLAASLVETERLEEAKEVLGVIRERAEREGHQLLLGNSHELTAQVHLQLGEYDAAEGFLELSMDALKSAPSRYRLYIEKWQAVVALSRNSKGEAALEALHSVRERALASNEWEVLRDCDFHESLARRDPEMFLRLYFGTPHAQYRTVMLRKNSGIAEIPELYIMGRGETLFDLATGQVSNEVVLKPEQALHRLATALLQDFYAPAGVAQLFAKVFSDEQFHPESSPHRIQELMRRLRSKLKEAGLPLEVESLERGYKVRLEQIHGFRLQLAATREVQTDLLSVVRSRFGPTPFKLLDLMEHVKLPHTTIYRQIKE